MIFSIVTPTYFREDNKSIFFLKRSLESILNQTHKEFKIILIGDRYENPTEILNLISQYPEDKIYFENLNVAKERDNYNNKFALWSYGGTNASNYGIEISLKLGIEFVCRLDHDDYWNNNHLEELAKCFEETKFDWACTKSNFVNGLIYPRISSNAKYMPYLPQPEALIHSSVCMNFKKIPLRYEDLFLKNGVVGLPGDAELWLRTSEYIKSNQLVSVLINEITCNHIEEGYERHKI